MEQNYYITATYGDQTHYVAGPFSSQEAADQVVEGVKDYAYKTDPISGRFEWAVIESAEVRKTPLGAITLADIAAA